MNKELTKEEAEEYYNKLWLENKELIQENIDKLNKKRFAQALMLAEKDKEIEKLKSIIKEVREYVKPVIVDGKEKELFINGNDILEILEGGKDT